MTNNARRNCKGNPSNSMTTILRYAWRPNNYRRQRVIKPLSETTIKKLLSFPGVVQNSHTKIISVKDYCDNVTVQVFKQRVIFIWKQERFRGVKKWFSVSGVDIGAVERVIEGHKAFISGLLDSAAEVFSGQFGVVYLGFPKWVRCEDALKGDAFLDSLPKELVIHAEHFKKVYADEVEFVGRSGDVPTAKMVRYINNRVVEQFTPEIAGEISANRFLIKDLLRVVQGFAVNMSTHVAVLKGIEKSFDKFNSLLSSSRGDGFFKSFDLFSWADENILVYPDDIFKHEVFISRLSVFERDLLSDYIFDKFGGV